MSTPVTVPFFIFSGEMLASSQAVNGDDVESTGLLDLGTLYSFRILLFCLHLGSVKVP